VVALVNVESEGLSLRGLVFTLVRHRQLSDLALSGCE
jgi:hypothetical protein